MKKRRSRCKPQNMNKKTPTTVPPIIPQQWAPVNRSQDNVGFCRPCSTKGHQAEKCPVISLQAILTLLKQRTINKCSLPSKRSGSLTQGRSQYYGCQINLSYCSSTSGQWSATSIILVHSIGQRHHQAEQHREHKDRFTVADPKKKSSTTHKGPRKRMKERLTF